MLKTKIIATLGPSTSSYDVIRRMILEGVSGFRINFSHGDPNIWSEWVKVAKEAADDAGRVISIMGDIPGPQVRTGEHDVLKVEARSEILLIYGDKSEESNTLPIPVKDFFNKLEPGDLVLLDDGKVLLRVTDVSDDHAEAIVLNDAVIYPRRKVVISGKELDLPFLSERDVEFIKFCIAKGFSYIAISYVRKPGDVEVVRDIVNRYNGKQGIIAKIETRSSIKYLSEIIRVADAVLIARGDLGLHYDLEKLPLLQRRIIREAIGLGKPCILATQLLESMVEYPRPSRSEVVDIVSAVNDYVDALLLTNETAIGKYPVETIKWLKRIVLVAEENTNRYSLEELRKGISEKVLSLREKYVWGLTLLAEKIGAKILIYTKKGTVPRLVSKFRPQVQVYVGTSEKLLAEKLTLYYGLKPYYLVGIGNIDYDDGVRKLYDLLRNIGELNYGDIVVEAYRKSEEEIHEIRIKQVI